MATLFHSSTIAKCHNSHGGSISQLLTWLGLMAMLLLAIVAYGIIERQGLPSMCSPRMSHVLGGHGDVPMTALIHYATTGVTPQQSKEEIMVTARVLSERGPCNLLVFGLGHDSMMWAALNVRGKTMFLEEDAAWIKETRKLHPSLRSVAVTYETKVSEAGELLKLAREEMGGKCGPFLASGDLRESQCEPLVLKGLPEEIYETRWDVVMIDGPRGYFADAPGRMSAIYSSAIMAINYGRGHGLDDHSTDILLHDIDRYIEKTFGDEFLCRDNLVETVGRLAHFHIRAGPSSSKHAFCSGS